MYFSMKIIELGRKYFFLKKQHIVYRIITYVNLNFLFTDSK